jgi:hypothetical protein
MAEQHDDQQRKQQRPWLTQHAFQPGTSGNPSGKPKERPDGPDAFRDLFQKILRTRPRLVERAVIHSLRDPKARVAMLAILRDSVDGRPGSDSGNGGPKVHVTIGVTRPEVTVVSPAPLRAALPAADGHDR